MNQYVNESTGRAVAAPSGHEGSRDGSCANGDAGTCCRSLDRRAPTDERDEHGRGDPSRFVRVLCRGVGVDDRRDDVAGGFTGRFETRSCQLVRSGFQYALCCLGSRMGLMLMLVALGVMSLAWMSVIAVLVLAQKLLPPRAALDVPC